MSPLRIPQQPLWGRCVFYVACPFTHLVLASAFEMFPQYDTFTERLIWCHEHCHNIENRERRQ
eukprot:2747181-Amphidinium_carterae.1